MENNKYIIYTPKSRYILSLAGSIILFTLSLLTNTFSFNTHFILTGLIRIVGLIATTFFGFGTIYIFYKLFSPTPALIIDANGITDKSAAITFGFIDWNDIDSIYTTEFMGKRVLAIKPKDIEKYLKKMNPLRAYIFKLNIKIMHTPFAIAEQNIPIPLEKVINEINKHFPSADGKIR